MQQSANRIDWSSVDWDEIASDPDALDRLLEQSEGKGQPTAREGESDHATGRELSWRVILSRSWKWLLASPLLIVLPFVIQVRLAVWAYSVYALTGWQSVAVGAGATLLTIALYIGLFCISFGRRSRFFSTLFKVALIAVSLYTGYTLLHLSSMNAKTEEVRSYYTSVHPLLRVAVANVTLADPDLVITDLKRTRQDYLDMGLQPLQASLHYPQENGFVHAVDLRTIGRSEQRNRLLELYFRMMGFRTLRHVGTADHLHISLLPN